MDAHEATSEKLKEGGPMCIFPLETSVVDAGLLSRVTRSLGNCFVGLDEVLSMEAPDWSLGARRCHKGWLHGKHV